MEQSANEDKYLAAWEPVDIDRDEISDEDVKWDNDVMKDLERRFEGLRQYNRSLNESRNEATREEVSTFVDTIRHDIEELVANQIYDKLSILLNNTRKKFDIQKGRPIDPIRNYGNFKLANDGGLTYIYKRTVIDLGNINERLMPPWEMHRLGVTKLKSMGFMDITDEDINPYKSKYKRRREEKLIKLDGALNKRLKAIESSSTADAEAIEMIAMTSKDIDTTVKDVEQDTSFIEPSERDKLLPLRELERLDKQLRTIKGSLKVAIAKRVDLEACIEHEERKLSEVQDPTYSDDQRDMTEGRIKRLRDELNERNEEIDILKGEASKQINQIRGSIMKFLDKEMGTFGERIRTLFKEQGIMIVFILTAVGMAIGFLIEALLGGPSVTATTTNTSGSTSGGDRKGGGARELIKNKLKALPQLLGKLANKALASLQGIIGSIISRILNRAKSGWLAVSELVGSHNRCRSFDLYIFHDKDKEKVVI